MDKIDQLLRQLATKEKERKEKLRSERDEQIRRFFTRIQLRDRKTKALRDASLEELALILRHCPTNQLHAFFQDCQRANHFAKFFWWSVKRKTPVQPSLLSAKSVQKHQPVKY